MAALSQCRYDIQGSLKCNIIEPFTNNDIIEPFNTYSSSCACRKDTKPLLICRCLNKDATKRVPTSIDPQQCKGRDIANCNGTLTCGNCP